MIGRTLGHYRILEEIGKGGMGVVYRARDERLERDVAVKVLPAGALVDDAARQRFRKEALALSKLNHPNIATIFDFDTQEGVDFLVMEHIAGETLAEKLQAGPLQESQGLKVGAQVAEGLEAGHREGIVHRDIKPGNLRLTPDGRVKILDFGLAKAMRPADEVAATTESLTRTQAVVGTLPYMAPEQLRGEPADARTDIYALGCVLYEMATGRRPFRETLATALSDAILHRAPVSPRALNERLSPELERITMKCLDKDPASRYQSVGELVVDLRRLATASAVLQAPSPQTPAWGRIASRWRVPPGSVWRVAIALVGIGLVAATLVGLNLGGLRERLFGPAAPKIDSLAVLPLDNLSGDPEEEYFVDGMTEELIAQLAQISALKVISRTSVMQYKKARKPLPEIARELDVDAVVEGSVRRAGNRVRITAQLVHAPSDRHLWAKSYERNLSDILTLQSEVAREIANEINVALTPHEQVRLAAIRPTNPEAHELYLKGRYYWNKRTEEELRKGLGYFQRAIEKDPGYALAYVGVADSYALLGSNLVSSAQPPREARPLGKAAALKALAIDNGLAEAHASLAAVNQFYDWDWAAAERGFRRALELNPNYAQAHVWYANYLMMFGRHAESLAAARRARELDPLSLVTNTSVGWRLYFARRYDDAIAEYRRAIELDPNFLLARHCLGWAYEEKGMHQAAIAEFRQALALSPDNPIALASLGHAYALAGNGLEARKALTQLQQLSKKRYVPAYYVAEVYLGLGRTEQALQWLEKAYDERSDLLVYIQVEPRLDPLRDDPRFQALARRMNFPEN